MSAFANAVKQWFQTGDKPEQGQLYNWMDNSRWKDEPIALTDMEQSFIDLINALGQPILRFEVTGTFEHTIPAGYIVEWVHVAPVNDCTITLDDGNGNTNDIDVVALHGEPITCMYAAGIDRTISITGLPLKTIIYVKRYRFPTL
jgi:hypothetical protein